MADTLDSKSSSSSECGFESHLGHKATGPNFGPQIIKLFIIMYGLRTLKYFTEILAHCQSPMLELGNQREEQHGGFDLRD